MIYLDINVNYYNKEGNIIFIAFMTYLKNREDDKTVSKLLYHLIKYDINIY